MSVSESSNLPFHFLVRAAILKNGRLLVNQFAASSFSFLPGGHVEPGEGLQGALKRELAEELGIELTVGKYLGAVEYLWKHNSTGQLHYEVNHVFEVRGPLGEIIRSNDPNLLFHWASLDKLEQYDLRPDPLRDLVRRWAAGDPDPWWASNLR